ncbi:hypothetical protein PV350_23340 [Streptomyces sp. PA03-6a]|nr:hypothetical protein [Streptomyces sp. PA03-6a]
MTIASPTGPGPGPFLLVWSLLAIAGGGLLATRKWSARFHGLVVTGLEGRPESQQRTTAAPTWLLRLIGGIFAIGGLIGLPLSMFMIVSG